MTLAALALSAGLSFLFLVLVFRPLELAFPAKRGQRFFRPGWFLDLCFFLGQYLLWGGLVVGVLAACGGWLQRVVPVPFREEVAAQPFWLQFLEMIALS